MADDALGRRGMAVLSGRPIVRLSAATSLLAAYGYCLFWMSPPEPPLASTSTEIVRDLETSHTAFSAGRYAEALAPTERLTHAMPTQAVHFTRLARIHHELGNAAGEADAWEQVFRTSPTPNDACPMLGRVYDDLKDQRRALDAYERCVEVSPDDPDALLSLGRAYSAAGRAADARRVLDEALTLAPEYPDLHLLLGVRNFADGRIADARLCFERFLDLVPGRRPEVAVWLERTETPRVTIDLINQGQR